MFTVSIIDAASICPPPVFDFNRQLVTADEDKSLSSNYISGPIIGSN